MPLLDRQVNQRTPTFVWRQPQLLLASKIHEIILWEVEKRIADGHYSESAMARLLTISQCHMNNLTKRRKALTTDIADKIIMRLKLDIVPLIERYQYNLEERRKKGESSLNSIHLVEKEGDQC